MIYLVNVIPFLFVLVNEILTNKDMEKTKREYAEKGLMEPDFIFK